MASSKALRTGSFPMGVDTSAVVHDTCVREGQRECQTPGSVLEIRWAVMTEAWSNCWMRASPVSGVRRGWAARRP